MPKLINAIVAAIFLFCASLVPASAQTLYGTLVGNVTDESGLAVPGATVKITQNETNQTREAVTGENGGYNFPNIPTGTYQVDVSLTGFQTASSRNVVVRQNTSVRVDVRLTVGALQETVLVSGTAAVLQTESAAVQMQTTSEQIVNLPTSGRSYQSFIGLMPGVAQPYMIQAGGINNPARSMGVSVNGQPPDNTLFRIDGAAVTNQWYPDIQSYSPSLEAVETVSVVTNSFDADQGMAGGAAVNVQVKSGTNSIGGSLFEYVTASPLKNRPFFLPANADKGDDTKNIFGGTIGGPLVRNKLFYFVSVETEVRRVKDGTVQLAEGETSTGTTGLNSLPPADLRRGDFSNTGTVIYDPLTGAANGTGRVPFAFANCPGLSSTTDPRFASCNYIPDNRINSIAKALLNDLVLPTGPGYTDNYYARDNYESRLNKIDTKLTWTPGNRLNLNNRLSWLGSRQNSHGIFPSLHGEEFNPLSVGRLWQANITSGSVLATSILSQTFVVDGVFGYTPYHSWVGPEGPQDECWGNHYGIINACQPPRSRDRATPMFSMTGWSMVTPSQMRDYADNQIVGSANAGWTKGTHNVKFGFDLQKNYLNHYETAVPVFTFNGSITALSGGTAPNNFNQFADFLLGLPFQRTAQVMTPLLDADGAKGPEWPATVRGWATGVYLRDQWQINPKMTASVGIRWEYYPFPTRVDRGLEMFDFTTNQLQVCGIGAANPKVCDIKVQKDLFTPRLGLAYRPTEDTVVRVGFSRNPQSDNAISRVGGIAQAFPTIINISQQGANTFTPVGSISEGVPLVPALDLTSGVVNLPSGAGVTTLEGDYERGTITSWNVSFQKLFPHALNVTLGYVANRQNDLTRQINLNYGQIGGGAASQPFNQVGLVNNLRTTAAMNVFRPVGKQTYDSFQTSVSRRMTNGLQFTSAYTYAHAINWWAGNIAIPEFYYLNKAVQGGGGGDFNASRSGTSTPHKVDASVIYQLPFGEGQPHMNGGGILDAIAGGWQVGSTFTALSGAPFTVTSSTASLNAPGNPQQADQIKDDVEINGYVAGGSYFDPLAFKSVTEVRFGNAAFNSLRGPGVRNFDFNATKTFRMGNVKTLQLKVEVFNLFNRPTFANPSTANRNVSNMQLNADGTVRALNGFGVINSTQSSGREYSERYVRLGLRMGF
jgi:hypothetical protein